MRRTARAGKVITQSTLIGQEGVNLIEHRVLAMGFVWVQRGAVEAGIDGHIELRNRDTGEVLNALVQVQSKATREPFDNETSESFTFTCDERDLSYWLQGNTPVVLVRSRPSTDEAYWVSIKDYFSDPSKRRSRTVLFNKAADRFDAGAAPALLALGVSRDRGLFSGPLRKPERLFSNLLRVSTLPAHVFTAQCHFKSRPAAWKALRDVTDRRTVDWMLRSDVLMSFHDLESTPWNRICDVGTVEAFRTSEWAESQDDERSRDFVELLNWSLRERLFRAHVAFYERLGQYYFTRTPSLNPRRIAFRSLARGSHRTVFKAYYSKKEPTKVQYYRHMAFQGQFRKFSSDWYLEIRPTYHFTRDGEKIDPWYQDKLAGMRRLERNAAVLQQVVMWADYLIGPKNELPLQTDESPRIEFDQLMTFEVPLGVDDKAWLAKEEDEDMVHASQTLEPLPLFDE